MGSTLIVAETPGRGLLLGSTEKACQSLNQRSDLSLPALNVIHVNPEPSCILSMIEEVPESVMVVAEVNPSVAFDAALDMGATVNSTGTAFAIAEQSVGSPPAVFSAGQLLCLIYHGAMAVFREYDFIAEDTVLQLLIEHYRRPRAKAVLIGDPARRLKKLIDEIQLEWNDPVDGPLFKPDFTFRLAASLTKVPELSPQLDTYEKIAAELKRRGWFVYNVDDTRKAVGALAHAWGLGRSRAYTLPQEARYRGFPDLSEADRLFGLIEDLDYVERFYVSASGNRFDVLYVSEV